MRAIFKRTEPASLAEYRTKANSGYDNFRDKDGLRRALVDEQRGVCCYCMCRIRPDEGRMKIAHWHSRKHHPDEELDYDNLLGACMGGHGSQYDRQHCDTHQRETDISRNPANPLHVLDKVIQFDAVGRIRSADSTFDAELSSVLNLNLDFLMNNRKAVLDAFYTTIGKRGPLARPTLEKWLKKWNGDSPHGGELEPYCQVVVYWLRKRLARA